MYKSTIAIAFTMLCMDAIWLTFRKTYHENLMKSVQGSPLKIRIIPAILIYILIPIAIVYFALSKSKTPKEAFINGAFFGFASYALYDLTNYATLKAWTVEMALIDTLWGTFICGASALAGFYFK